jgi:hypothetical protein
MLFLDSNTTKGPSGSVLLAGVTLYYGYESSASGRAIFPSGLREKGEKVTVIVERLSLSILVQIDHY